MDGNIAARLDARERNPHYDARFANEIATTGRQYLEAGIRVVNNYVADFDAASDITDMLMPVEDATAFAKVDRNAALNFRHPAAFTQMHVLTTFISQILFGGQQSRSVEAQGEDDADKADDVNALLAWNDDKIKLYTQGWLWVWNAIVYNRGIWFEDAGQDVEVVREPVEEDDISKPKVPLLTTKGVPIIRKGVPVLVYQKKQRMRNKRSRSGFYNRLTLVSPYDFICDPAMPFVRFQESRYAGHRVWIPWHELKRRSELEPTDDDYVLPHVVLKIKNAGINAVTPSPLGGTTGLNSSRTYYERTIRGGGIVAGGIGGNGVGGATGVDGVNKQDGGTVECFVLTIRAKPKMLKMYEDDEFELIRMLVTSSGDVLSLNTQPNKHDEFPYCVAESIPNGIKQFSPGWALKAKPVQDHIDALNITHTKAQARMGNIMLVDQAKCDVSNLLSPDKNGLLITRTAEGKGVPVDDCVSQLKVEDTTANYPEEMAMWTDILETMTGANSYTQGQTEDPNQTLGQFDATRQMATGRISSLARILSETGLVPQTRRFVMSLQQFCSDEQMIRIIGNDSKEYDPTKPRPKYKVIKKTNIQGSFDVVGHDGSLPGADAKVVAAAARTIEAYAANPQLAQAFNITQPGAIDITKLLYDLLRKSGLPVDKYAVSIEEAKRNQLAAQQAQGIFPPQGGQQPPPAGAAAPVTPPPPTLTPGGAVSIPTASEVPPLPPATPPQLTGVTS